MAGVNEITADTLVTINGTPDLVEEWRDWKVTCPLSQSLEVALNRWREMIPDGEKYAEYKIWTNRWNIFEIEPWGIKIDRRLKKLLRYDELDFSDIEFELEPLLNKKYNEYRGEKRGGIANATYIDEDLFHMILDESYESYKSGKIFNTEEEFAKIMAKMPEDFPNPPTVTGISNVFLTDYAIIDAKGLTRIGKYRPGDGHGVKEFSTVALTILDIEKLHAFDDLLYCEPEHSRGIYRRIINDYMICYIVEDGKFIVLDIFMGMLGHKDNMIELWGDDKKKPRIIDWI